jgi:hypothetical protein
MTTIEYDLLLPNGNRDQLRNALNIKLPKDRVLTLLRSHPKRKERGLLMIADLATSPHKLVDEISHAKELSAELTGVALLNQYNPPKQADVISTWELLTELLPDVQPYTPIDIASLRRIISAHLYGGREQRIASAQLKDDELLIWSCEPKLYSCLMRDLKPLRSVDREQWECFRVSSSGSYLSWEQLDIDIDLDTIRYAIDPEFKEQQDQKRYQELQRYAKGIVRLRQEHQLNRKECGISDYELRQIESGIVMPNHDILRTLAAAHKMSLSDYLEAVSRAIPTENT